MAIESTGAERGNPRFYSLIENAPKTGKSPTIWAWPQITEYLKVAGQPVQVAANEPQIGAPPNEVSTATEPAPAASVTDSVVDLIVAPATTAPASAEPPAPAPAPAEPAAVAPPAAP